MARKGYYHRSGSFVLALQKFAEKAGANADAVVRKTVLDIGTRIVERSPVGDGSLWKHPPPKGYVGGRFRANWQYGNFSGAGIPVNELPDIDVTGAMSLARIMSGIPKNAAGIRHILVNNLPYAQALEDGHSTQAPSGMVVLAVLEFQEIVNDAVSEVNK